MIITIDITPTELISVARDFLPKPVKVEPVKETVIPTNSTSSAEVSYLSEVYSQFAPPKD